LWVGIGWAVTGVAYGWRSREREIRGSAGLGLAAVQGRRIPRGAVTGGCNEPDATQLWMELSVVTGKVNRRKSMQEVMEGEERKFRNEQGSSEMHERIGRGRQKQIIQFNL
jgi:Zn ribbon nucleic-acid-binding protein